MSDLQYLLVYNSHNGSHIRIPKPIRFHTLVDFKRHIAQELNVDPIETLFILSSFGIKLNFLLINDFSDIFVYDRRLFTPKPDIPVLQAHLEQNAILPVDELPDPPHISDSSDSQNIVYLYEDWAATAASCSSRLADKSRNCIKHINVMFRSLNLIYLFCTNFVNDIQKSFNNYFSYIKLLHYKTLQKTWPAHFAQLAKFSRVQLQGKEFNLVTFLDERKLKSMGQFAGKHLPRVVKKFNDMSTIITNVSGEQEIVLKLFESLRDQSIAAFKDVDIDIAVSNIQQCVGAITKPPTPRRPLLEVDMRRECSQATTIVAGMLRNFKTLVRFKLKLATDCLKVFSTIASLQKQMVDVKDNLKSMTMPGIKSADDDGITYELINEIKQSEDYMSLTVDLPLIFGYMLIEKTREKEWNEVYSRGIVSNVSEQLSCLISHEDQARKIWIRKFGRFLEMVSEKPIQVSLPSIDVTLVPAKQDEFVTLLGVQVDRADIARYIKVLETFPPTKAFATMVEKQFQDLVRQSSNLQKVSRVVSSIATVTKLDNNEIAKPASKGSITTERDGEEKRPDTGGSQQDIFAAFDAELVDGLKQRIKKLESLLHLQLYTNVNGWPVTHGSRVGNEVDVKMSLIVDQKTAGGSPRKPAMGDARPQVLTDPKLLLQRRSTSDANAKSQLQSRLLDSSGIDKHLDNIRLKKENAGFANRISTMEACNAELTEENNMLKALTKQKTDEVVALEAMKNSLVRDEETKNSEIVRLHEELECKKNEHYAETNELRSEIETLKAAAQAQAQSKEHELTLAKYETTFVELKEKSEEAETKSIDLAGQVANLTLLTQQLKDDLKDEFATKTELASGFSAKEAGYVHERSALELKIEALLTMINEKTQDHERLKEVTLAQQKSHESLIELFSTLVRKLIELIMRLVNLNYDSFVEFCLALESMGLLLVKEEGCYRVSRVKGLRSKNETSDDLEEIDKPPASTIVDEFKQKVAGLSSLLTGDVEQLDASLSRLHIQESGNGSDGPSLANDSMQLIERLHALHDESSPLIEFFTEISFKHNVQIRDDKSHRQHFFVNAISKRFKDVEGFAKRQAKESKSKQVIVDRLTTKLSSSISVNNFQPKDLALFLPTRVECDPGQLSDILVKPWAAFNVGAPHYFLRNSGSGLTSIEGREWMVARITSVSESRVTHENYSDVTQNPFQLSVGILWFLVEAEEEML